MTKYFFIPHGRLLSLRSHGLKCSLNNEGENQEKLSQWNFPAQLWQVFICNPKAASDWELSVSARWLYPHLSFLWMHNPVLCGSSLDLRSESGWASLE